MQENDVSANLDGVSRERSAKIRLTAESAFLNKTAILWSLMIN